MPARLLADAEKTDQEFKRTVSPDNPELARVRNGDASLSLPFGDDLELSLRLL